jgi:hypothetical protein
MSKPISRPLHGALDYGYGAAIAGAPELFDFKNEPTAAILCRAMGALTTLTSLCTRYEMGVLRVLPFKMHLAGDALTGIFALAAPFALGFSENAKARNTFLGFGILALLVAALTQNEEMNS